MSTGFSAPKASLAAAERALGRMRTAGDSASFLDAWNQFLSELEKVWEKTKASGKRLGSTRFDPWIGERVALRRKDPVLRFLFQARDADHHGIEEVDAVKHTPQVIDFRPAQPGGTHIEYLTVGPDGIEYRGDKPLLAAITPAKYELQRIVSRGTACEPPSEHLGQRLKYTDPVFVAHAGLKWYEQMVAEAEAEFSGLKAGTGGT